MIRTYKYGTRRWADQSSLAFREQLMLTRDLWNTAVTLEKEHEAAKDGLWAGHRITAGPWQEVIEAREKLAGLHKQAAAHRSADRTTRPRADTSALLDEARQGMRDALNKLAEAREQAYPELKEAFTELKQSCRTCQAKRSSPPDSLYKQFRRYGLGWGTVNDVLQRRLPAAMKMAREAGGEMRRKPGDGTGSLTVQLQTGRGKRQDLLPLPAVLEWSGNPWAKDCHLEMFTWQQRSKPIPQAHPEKFAQVRLRISERCTITLPFTMHRPLPEDGVIKEVKVTRSYKGGRYRMSIAFVVHVPDPVPPEGGIRFVQPRWKREQTGAILVATVGSTTVLPPVPHDLRNFVFPHEGGVSADIRMPSYIGDLLEQIAKRQGRRDQAQDGIRISMANALASDPVLEKEVGTAASTVIAIRRPEKLHRLAQQWPQDHPLHVQLDTWRRTDRHRYQSVAFETDQIIAHRRDAWKKAAAWVCDGARSLGMGNIPVAKLKVTPLPGEEDTGERGRKHIQDTAPGEMRQLMVIAALMRAIPVHDVTPGKIGNDDAE
jgi:hypothetical protein